MESVYVFKVSFGDSHRKWGFSGRPQALSLWTGLQHRSKLLLDKHAIKGDIKLLVTDTYARDAGLDKSTITISDYSDFTSPAVQDIFASAPKDSKGRNVIEIRIPDLTNTAEQPPLVTPPASVPTVVSPPLASSATSMADPVEKSKQGEDVDSKPSSSASIPLSSPSLAQLGEQFKNDPAVQGLIGAQAQTADNGLFSSSSAISASATMARIAVTYKSGLIDAKTFMQVLVRAAKDHPRLLLGYNSMLPHPYRFVVAPAGSTTSVFLQGPEFGILPPGMAVSPPTPSAGIPDFVQPVKTLRTYADLPNHSMFPPSQPQTQPPQPNAAAAPLTAWQFNAIEQRRAAMQTVDQAFRGQKPLPTVNYPTAIGSNPLATTNETAPAFGQRTKPATQFFGPANPVPSNIHIEPDAKLEAALNLPNAVPNTLDTAYRQYIGHKVFPMPLRPQMGADLNPQYYRPPQAAAPIAPDSWALVFSGAIQKMLQVTTFDSREEQEAWQDLGRSLSAWIITHSNPPNGVKAVAPFNLYKGLRRSLEEWAKRTLKDTQVVEKPAIVESEPAPSESKTNHPQIARFLSRMTSAIEETFGAGLLDGIDLAHPFEDADKDASIAEVKADSKSRGAEEKTPTTQVHNATCDICSKTIHGIRYKCLQCPDWDTCEFCFDQTSLLHSGHQFLPVADASRKIRAFPTSPRRHPHITCDGCDKPIYGIRYKCTHSACHDFDLCANCEALPHGVHPDDHHLLKIKVPVVARTVADSVQAARKVGQPLVPDVEPRQTQNALLGTIESDVDCPDFPCTLEVLIDANGQLDKIIVKAPAVQPESEPEPEVGGEVHEPTADASLTATFVKDLTIEDGSVLPPGALFQKGWLVKNTGSKAWPHGVQLLKVGGFTSADERKDAVSYAPACEPGEEQEIWVEMHAPEVTGQYMSFYRFVDEDGQRFGDRLWVEIDVQKDGNDTPSDSMASSSIRIPLASTSRTSTEMSVQSSQAPSLVGQSASSSDIGDDTDSEFELISEDDTTH